MEAEVKLLVDTLVRSVATKDMLSASVCLTKLNKLGITETDLFSKGYINVISTKSTKKSVEPTVRKKKPSSKSRRSSR